MARTTWHRLMESTEGPTVTIQIPREWAEELMRALMTSLEIEDMGGEPDMEDEPHAEPDEDDFGGMPDMDDDDEGPLGFSAGDEEGDEPDFAAGDDDDEEEPDDDSDDDDDDEDDDDDDEKEEGIDFSGSDRNTRPKTALGESAFARAGRLAEKHIGFKKLKGQLSHQKGVKNPGALAASIGRKKYGAKGMARKSAAGRK